MLSEGTLNLKPPSPAAAAADTLSPMALQQGENGGEAGAKHQQVRGVSTSASSSPVPTPDFRVPTSPSPSSPLASSASPTPPLDHSATSPLPNSPLGPEPASGGWAREFRKPAPLTFDPVHNDEANILARISSGEFALNRLAEDYHTTVHALSLWLQREDIQKKLADITSAGGTITRVGAVNQLPKAVKSLSFQLDSYISDRRHCETTGLDTDRINSTRDANARKACNLLLRLARFDPSRPLYRKHERRGNDSEVLTADDRLESRESSTLSPMALQRGEVVSPKGEPVRGALPLLVDLINEVRAQITVPAITAADVVSDSSNQAGAKHLPLSPASGSDRGGGGDVTAEGLTEGATSDRASADRDQTTRAQHVPLTRASLPSPIPETRYPIPDFASSLPTSEFRVPTSAGTSPLDHSATSNSFNAPPVFHPSAGRSRPPTHAPPHDRAR